MVRTIVMLLIGAGVGWIVWRRWSLRPMPSLVVTPERLAIERSAVEAFMHGNACLRDGQFAEASAAFCQAGELDPKLPYVAARLDEVARQQAGGASHLDRRLRSA